MVKTARERVLSGDGPAASLEAKLRGILQATRADATDLRQREQRLRQTITRLEAHRVRLGGKPLAGNSQLKPPTQKIPQPYEPPRTREEADQRLAAKRAERYTVVRKLRHQRDRIQKLEAELAMLAKTQNTHHTMTPQGD